MTKLPPRIHFHFGGSTMTKLPPRIHFHFYPDHFYHVYISYLPRLLVFNDTGDSQFKKIARSIVPRCLVLVRGSAASPRPHAVRGSATVVLTIRATSPRPHAGNTWPPRPHARILIKTVYLPKPNQYCKNIFEVTIRILSSSSRPSSSSFVLPECYKNLRHVTEDSCNTPEGRRTSTVTMGRR